MSGMRRLRLFLLALALPLILASAAEAAPRFRTIAQARTLPVGTLVTVVGAVTTPSGAFESSLFDQGFALQDATGGIYIKTSTDLHLAPRRQAQVTGAVQESFGLRVIVPASPSDVLALGVGPQVQPQWFSTAAINESTEGLLVRVIGRVSQAPESDLPYGYKFWVDDGSGEVLIFINVQSDIDVSGIALGDMLNVTGFSSQFDTHYEIDPRTPKDIVRPVR